MKDAKVLLYICFTILIHSWAVVYRQPMRRVASYRGRIAAVMWMAKGALYSVTLLVLAGCAGSIDTSSVLTVAERERIKQLQVNIKSTLPAHLISKEVPTRSATASLFQGSCGQGCILIPFFIPFTAIADIFISANNSSDEKEAKKLRLQLGDTVQVNTIAGELERQIEKNLKQVAWLAPMMASQPDGSSEMAQSPSDTIAESRQEIAFLIQQAETKKATEMLDYSPAPFALSVDTRFALSPTLTDVVLRTSLRLGLADSLDLRNPQRDNNMFNHSERKDLFLDLSFYSLLPLTAPTSADETIKQILVDLLKEQSGMSTDEMAQKSTWNQRLKAAQDGRLDLVEQQLWRIHQLRENHYLETTMASAGSELAALIAHALATDEAPRREFPSVGVVMFPYMYEGEFDGQPIPAPNPQRTWLRGIAGPLAAGEHIWLAAPNNRAKRKDMDDTIKQMDEWLQMAYQP